MQWRSEKLVVHFAPFLSFLGAFNRIILYFQTQNHEIFSVSHFQRPYVRTA